MAKIANNVGKSTYKGNGTPRVIKAVAPGEEADFLAPLPTYELWGIGPKTASRLQDLGVETIGDLANLSENWLAARFGKSGSAISRHAKGIDLRPVINFHDAKSISNEVTFSKDICDKKELQGLYKAFV